MTVAMGADARYTPAEAEPVLRTRSAGCLNAAAVGRCRRDGRALAFDPMQSGWVPDDVEDDLADHPLAGSHDATTHGHRTRMDDVGATNRRGLALGAYLLRPWHDTDAPRLATLLGDATVWRHLPERYPGALSVADAAGMIALAAARSNHEVLAIERDGTVIGQIRLEFAPGATEAELSYWFGRTYWGRGHAGRVVPAFVGTVGERHPRLERLTARVHHDNPASEAVLARAGFLRMPEADAPPWRFYGCVIG